MAGIGVAFFVVFALLVPFLLYVAVRAEHSESETMDRKHAETVARKDTVESQTQADNSERKDDDSGWD